MPEAVVIRPATMRDLEGLASLLLTVTPRGVNAAVNGDTPNQCLERMLTNGRGRVLAAFGVDGTVVGMCSGTLTTCMAEGGPAVLIEDVVVREDRRGQGLGARLVDMLADRARDDQAGRLALLADPDASLANGPEATFKHPDIHL
ncbi:GNAT family N-acetyltransferase [Pseudodesulfovibrio indicus]|uniref:Ribosomal protein S18 acetylase RimI-like enzyme n=1 Tax=Pseudodesulfovibrio indicus TaxID=1716143 RepID=A0A126QLP6_9BACT|nr:GNAT family N-acetyltransferase [Pseudodesulfovibrio indicus]AMK10980.1 hypothetical protein AWY79_07565 [Pseudodesulfovibrio indicus]TDT91980.1 ribosomal protein S18 acetylase RimI-like enzyme [Pseudodesulfovibrio indicus]